MHLLRLSPTLFFLAITTLSTLAAAAITQTATSTVTLSGATSTILPTNVVATTSGLSPQYTDQAIFQSSLLNSTNYWRYLYSAPFLSFNSSLAAYAQSYSEKCNLARGYPDVVGSVDAWGNESTLFDFGSTSNGQSTGKGGYTGWSEATGHFTQLVWRETQTVGCGWTACNGKKGLEGVFLVCNYYPAGNVVGPTGSEDEFFLTNVQMERGGGAQGYNATAGAEGVGGVSASATGTAATVTVSAMAAGLLRPGWEVGSRWGGGKEGLVDVGVLLVALGMGLGLV